MIDLKAHSDDAVASDAMRFATTIGETCGADRLREVIVDRYWLADKLDLSTERLDRLLQQLHRRDLIRSANDRMIKIANPSALKKMMPSPRGAMTNRDSDAVVVPFRNTRGSQSISRRTCMIDPWQTAN